MHVRNVYSWFLNIVTSGCRHYVAQKRNSQVTWRLPDDAALAAPTRSGEPIVGGVYLRLFVGNPGWVVRRPKEFLSELMDTCLALMNKEKLDVSSGPCCRS
jgi:DnaJ family protein C protein 13